MNPTKHSSTIDGMEGHTPVMQQYLSLKKAHPETILFYRMGDFYEMFYEDAKKAAEVLGIALTQRGHSAGKPIPMAGVPHHQARIYLKKFLDAGHKVAICEQMELPGAGRGPVKRAVVRTVTPGTLTEDDLLDPLANNYLVALALTAAQKNQQNNELAVAALDLSTGVFQVVLTRTLDRTLTEISLLSPSEVIIPEGWDPPEDMAAIGHRLTRRPDWEFDPDHGTRNLLDHFQVTTLDAFGIEDSPVCQAAAGALIGYCLETQKGSVRHITSLTRIEPNDVLILDDICRRNLEINTTLHDRQRKGSLLATLDLTMTSLGSRLMAAWLNRPLRQIDAIHQRQDAVAWLLRDPGLRLHLRTELKGIADLERLLSRITLGRSSPRDLGSLRGSLARLPNLAALLDNPKIPSLLAILLDNIRGHEALHDRLQTALADDPLPTDQKEGNIIRNGFDAHLDRLRTTAREGKLLIQAMERDEQKKTGIARLKIQYHRTFGYSIEVSNAQLEKVPHRYQQRQTMTNAVRYVTAELKELEESIENAEEGLVRREETLCDAIRQDVATHTAPLQVTARALATLDLLAAFAEMAERHHYCRPEVHADTTLDIRQGRHPVVELFTDKPFVPNDALLDGDNHRLIMLTGPNMGGKSTWMRQVALITLMAHTGSFVPAQSARIGLVDRIFTRVGAGDDLAGGRSTFMVEMTETAHILHQATHHSLILLDEIGRGTSTLDGLAIAQAVAEHIHDVIGARTIFATHYHELTALEQHRSGVVNHTVAVQEWQETILFLHTIMRGQANRSYGIHVARFAGLPRQVTQQADAILATLEGDPAHQLVLPNNLPPGQPSDPTADRYHTPAPPTAMLAKNSHDERSSHPVITEIMALDTDSLTPRQAMETLYRLKEMAATA
ncbi:MAG: DNA mismatch repair protein MutS [Magnetococcales bacterium]|nr:DNA mismatch repair protein MutS [Magnetococcales bacterium]